MLPLESHSQCHTPLLWLPEHLCPSHSFVYFLPFTCAFFCYIMYIYFVWLSGLKFSLQLCLISSCLSLCSGSLRRRLKDMLSFSFPYSFNFTPITILIFLPYNYLFMNDCPPVTTVYSVPILLHCYHWFFPFFLSWLFLTLFHSCLIFFLPSLFLSYFLGPLILTIVYV